MNNQKFVYSHTIYIYTLSLHFSFIFNYLDRKKKIKFYLLDKTPYIFYIVFLSNIV
jgi:hypothetical protein